MPNLILINLSPNIISQKTLSFPADNYKTVGDVRQKLASIVHKDIELYLVTQTIEPLNHSKDLTLIYNYLNTNNVYPVLGFGIPSNKLVENKTVDVKPLSPPTDVKPLSPPIEVKPLSTPTVIRSSSPPTEIKPLSPSTEVKPLSPSTEVKPLSPSTEVKPLSPSNEIKPLSPSIEIKPLSQPTEVKPLSPSKDVECPISSESLHFSEEDRRALGIILKELESEWLYNESHSDRSEQIVYIPLKYLSNPIRCNIMYNIKGKTSDETITYIRDLLNISNLEDQLEGLPQEIVVLIISKLSINDIISIGATNKYYRNLILDSLVLQTKAREINYKLKTNLSLRKQWLDLIKYHDKNYYSPRCLKANNNNKDKCLILAAKAGEIEIMERMLNRVTGRPKIAIVDQILVAVLEVANYKTIDYILDKYFYIINFGDLTYQRAAIRSGDVDLYNRIKGYTPGKMIPPPWVIVYEAGRSGNSRAFSYYMDSIKEYEPHFSLTDISYSLIKYNVTKKDVDMIKTILSYLSPITDPQIKYNIAKKLSSGVADPDIEDLFWTYYDVNSPGHSKPIFAKIFSKSSLTTIIKFLTINKEYIDTILDENEFHTRKDIFIRNIVQGLVVSVERDLEIWRFVFNHVQYTELFKRGFNGLTRPYIFLIMVDNNDVARFDLIIDKGFPDNEGEFYDQEAINVIYKEIINIDNRSLFDHLVSRNITVSISSIISYSHMYDNYYYFKKYLPMYQPNDIRLRADNWVIKFFHKMSTMTEYLEIITLMGENSYKLSYMEYTEYIYNVNIVLYLDERQFWSNKLYGLHNFRYYYGDDRNELKRKLLNPNLNPKRFAYDLIVVVSFIWRYEKISDEEYIELLSNIRIAYPTVLISNLVIYSINKASRDKLHKVLKFLQSVEVVDYEFMMISGLRFSSIEIVRLAIELGGEDIKKKIPEMMMDFYIYFDISHEINRPIWKLLLSNLEIISGDRFMELISKIAAPIEYTSYDKWNDIESKISNQAYFDSELNTLLNWGNSNNIINLDVYEQLKNMSLPKPYSSDYKSYIAKANDTKQSALKTWLDNRGESFYRKLAASSNASGRVYNSNIYQDTNNNVFQIVHSSDNNQSTYASSSYIPQGSSSYNPQGSSSYRPPTYGSPGSSSYRPPIYSPTYIPPNYRPPTYSPPSNAPTTQIPPTYGPPTYAPPSNAPTTQIPTTYGPPTYGSSTYNLQTYNPQTYNPQAYNPNK